MQKQRFVKASLTAVLGLVAALVIPAAAQAHYVAGATATCELVNNVPTATFNVSFKEFEDTSKPVSGTIWVDGKPNAVQPFTWPGQDYTLVWKQATTPGTHTIKGEFTWPNQNDYNGKAEATVTCPAPAAPPATPAGGGSPPAGGGAPPASGTLPKSIKSGRARLRGASGCMQKTFSAKVRGRSIASVVFYVDGRQVKRISGKHGVYSVKVKPRRYAIGRHRIVARVEFVTGSGTQPRELSMMFRRCAQGAVSPRFTG